MNPRTWLVTIMATAALAGCGGGDGDDAPGSPDAPPASNPDARPAAQVVATVTPANATAGDTLTLHVAVMNFTLVNPTTSPPPALGEGHFHIYFDDAVDYSAGWDPDTEITTTATDAGDHTVRVILVNSLHMELAPVTESTAPFALAPAP